MGLLRMHSVSEMQFVDQSQSIGLLQYLWKLAVGWMHLYSLSFDYMKIEMCYSRYQGGVELILRLRTDD